MFEVKRSERTIDHMVVETWIATLIGAGEMLIEVGTTGHRENYRQAYSYFRLDCPHSEFSGNSFTLRGNIELDMLIQAFEFAAKVLKEQRSSDGLAGAERTL